MSIYTSTMVNALTAHGAFTYEQAVEFAAANDLSTRSVISKIKSLGLEYTPKQKGAASKSNEVRKSDIVSDFATAIGADPDKLSGLAKADKLALLTLVSTVMQLIKPTVTEQNSETNGLENAEL